MSKAKYSEIEKKQPSAGTPGVRSKWRGIRNRARPQTARLRRSPCREPATAAANGCGYASGHEGSIHWIGPAVERTFYDLRLDSDGE